MRALVLQSDRLYCRALAAMVKDVFENADVVIVQRARQALRLLYLIPVAVAIMGVDPPDLDGLDFLPEVVNSHLVEHTVILCPRDDPRTLSELRRLPFAGLVDSSAADTAELRRALTQVASGRRYVSPTFKDRFAGPGFPWRSNLSVQQEIVLSLLGEGIDNERAAVRLGTSPEMVRSHRCRIMRKLGLHQKGEIVEYALANRYVRYSTLGFLHPGLERALEAAAARTAEVRRRPA